MSRIYFHSPSAEAEVRGWERAYAGSITDKLGFNLLTDVLTEDDLRAAIIDGHELKTFRSELGAYGINSWTERLRLSMTGMFGGDRPMIEYQGESLNSWILLLNTAVAGGSDSMRLLARIHAQCELHGFLEGEDRAWFADLIEQGRAQNVLRPGSGWESVCELLRSRDDEPVVTSYSVCDSFPNAGASTWQPADDEDDDYDAWYELPIEDQWRMGMDWLRDNGPRFQPSDWSTYRFGHCVSAFDIAADFWAAKMTEPTRVS